ncbi:MAG TPA: NADP-dependent oxidoreductase [Gemmatimonadaceae bacterium]|nr:NADP-dependent oxidoreductase [Gemmatimonadaceae bacterium]
MLQPGERPDPVPAAGEVLVRIRAACVNPTDLAARSAGNAYIHELEPPFVPGWDLAGEVAALGDFVTTFSVGDRVCGMIPFARIGGRVGAYAELAAVPPEWLSPLADTVSFDDAATLPLNSLTAHQALEHFDLSPGERLLVTGASGGVGGFAVSLAARVGLSVIAVAGRDDEEWVRSLGATTVLPRDADLGAIAPVDGVLDAVPVGAERSAVALRSGCTAVFTRPPTSPPNDGNHYETVRVQSDPATLHEMAALLAAGVLRTRVARVLPLEAAAEAHRLVERGGLHGKVILRP